MVYVKTIMYIAIRVSRNEIDFTRIALDVMQVNYNVQKELFSCLQTHWCKHGSILP
jgi:hypothetical protein